MKRLIIWFTFYLQNIYLFIIGVCVCVVHACTPQWSCERTTIRSCFSYVEVESFLILLLCTPGHLSQIFESSFPVWTLQYLKSLSWSGRKTQNTVRLWWRVGIWGGSQPFCESLICGLFLCRFQVTGQVEDKACALITRKGVFSEKCFIHNYWICQDSSTEDDIWMTIAISLIRKESATMEICIFSPQTSETRSH